MMGFWAVLGLTIDTLYRGQALLFGDQTDAITIIKKVFVDQCIFSVFWSAPFTTLAMYWKEHNFSFQTAKKEFSGKIFTQEIPAVLIALWGVWIPAVAIIYSLPLALQFPLFSIVLCFWSLLVTALNNGESK
jgi:hypothetical protein